MSSDFDHTEINEQHTSSQNVDVPVKALLTAEAVSGSDATETVLISLNAQNDDSDSEKHEGQPTDPDVPTCSISNNEKDNGEPAPNDITEIGEQGAVELKSSMEECYPLNDKQEQLKMKTFTKSVTSAEKLQLDEVSNELKKDTEESIDSNEMQKSENEDVAKSECKLEPTSKANDSGKGILVPEDLHKADYGGNITEAKHIDICQDTKKPEESNSLNVESIDVRQSQDNDLALGVNVQLELVSELSSSCVAETTKSATTSGIGLVDENIAEADSDIFTDKDCINCECPKKHKQFHLTTLFALNYFKVSRKRYKSQYICIDCYNNTLDVYEKYASILVHKQPLLLHEIVNKRYDYVEIDSTDEEDANECNESAVTHFSNNDLVLIENELESACNNVFQNIEIQNQLTWSKTLLTERTRAIGSKLTVAEQELRRVQEIADRMHNNLYYAMKLDVKELPPLEINYGPHSELTIPPAGEIERPAIQINGTYYAVKTKAIASWVPCRVIEHVDALPSTSTSVGVPNFKIKYLMAQYQMVKTVSWKHLAYYDPPAVRLIIGTRVIAYFDASTLARGKEKVLAQSAFYPGIIAEPLKQANKFRYLIFYDDGYTQYVQHKDVRLVCQASDKVWEDVHPASRDFIQKYVEQYSVNRPMVQTQKGQSMNTESNGTWHYARVIDIDCSLILMQFEGPRNHTEWIYRGSLRLGPVFKEYQKSLQKKAIMHQSRMPRRTEPFIRYTEEMETSNTQANTQRSLAKKSVSRPSSFPSTSAAAAALSSSSPSVRHLNNSTIYVDDENRPKGKVVFYTAKRNLPPRDYKPHYCIDLCLYKITANLDGYSPLAKPLLSGWERMIFKQKIKRTVVYRAPCGKSLRNTEEVRRYLRATLNDLNVDNFDFCPDLNCLAEYVIDSAIVQRRDISNGQEKIAIPLVNYYDKTLPPPCIYAAQRIPTEGVFLNLDEEFLPGCDCEDDCSDKSKCSCWQLTIEGVRYCNPNKPIEEIGYQYKRLLEHVATGIYECNSRCKCKSNCLNRVVQHSLEMKLQVFKTCNRGWGLRCINDIPKGAFICIYAGHLLTETKANEGGIDAGDEYFADLDYIEVAEQLKEGYESDVDHSEPDEEEDTTYRPDLDDDDEFRPNKYYTKRNKPKERLSRGNLQSQAGEEDSQERQVISFNPNADMDETVRENSVRRLFGKDEAPYIMDAKTTGNLGRYFNHSCSPNLFVQNVFVDTHDLRFPWVAFFAATQIRSGAELTWNYNYEVGVVPGKVLYCQCGSHNCRVRLL